MVGITLIIIILCVEIMIYFLIMKNAMRCFRRDIRRNVKIKVKNLMINLMSVNKIIGLCRIFPMGSIKSEFYQQIMRILVGYLLPQIAIILSIR